MSIPLPPKRRKPPGVLYYDALASFGWLRELWKYRSSSYSLIAANCLPLLGVLFLGWDAFAIVVLYWSENVVIGAINVLKMITCDPDPNLLVLGNVDPNDKLNSERMKRSRGDSVKMLRLANHGSKFLFVPFFTLHYGLFCFIHGVFIFAIFGREQGGFGPYGGFDNFLDVFSRDHLWWCVAALAASHIWSFAVNYIGRGEYRRTAVPILMFQPYARIIVLHVAILLGGFVAFALGSNFFVLTLLIAGKTMLDLSLHIMEREKNSMFRAVKQEVILPEVIMGEPVQTKPTPPATVQSHPQLRSSSGD